MGRLRNLVFGTPEQQKQKKLQKEMEQYAYAESYRKARIKGIRARAEREGRASAIPLGQRLERGFSGMSRDAGMLSGSLRGPYGPRRQRKTKKHRRRRESGFTWF